MRLIPAHAGKTRSSASGAECRQAHPRSRGENTSMENPSISTVGSSPLTRGKQPTQKIKATIPRLIPAHAGKTPVRWRESRPLEAHPRSRGENFNQSFRFSTGAGSSPLTRGKRDRVRPVRSRIRLIPAHAGKTHAGLTGPREDEAHPRSRGENQGQIGVTWDISGSSPLTRGKPGWRGGQCTGRRLIPAHAGKTLPDLRFYCADRSDLGNP